MDTSHPILFFDGVCNLCNGAVQFILKHDRRGELRFASLQSDIAEELLPRYGIDPKDLNSVVLYQKGKVYTRSTSVLKTLELMGGPLSYLAIFGIIPRQIRDFFYNYVSHHRYNWFGKRENCMLPRPEWKTRFLEG
ncbi:putative DCC family thiol-disulfide oxidoreductase YuxK [Neolewinella xylanilytica]|uniref:Putative DCC family thiol-disulfide oxidoreductase YuxK n=1 Tax=Neolewinella xylanilytica TaxID=1514080 RepID=A0A2S6I8Y3_9BACT|nr:thiol-disulfide oxidoreductase DCC family protein [Neolewinella xylanilytica]PPK87942.1 putative DCC family thiol-disulfide oxidoreductase YuxK [Neolewinella xylanilytica]